jgi:hypothetical protein
MEPSLDIRKLRPGLYAYSLTAGGEPLGDSTGAHGTISECLQDAAQELGDGFPSVRVGYGATGLGSFPSSRLANDPEGLADELMERVSALIDARR